MKLLAAVAIYVGIAGLIGLGMVLAVKGSPALLVLGVAGFVLAFARIGCTQQ